MEKLKITVDNEGHIAVFMDGHRVKGVRRITFEYEAGFPPSHTIEYVTQKGGVAIEPEAASDKQ